MKVAAMKQIIKLILVLLIGQCVLAKKELQELDYLAIDKLAIAFCESNDSYKIFISLSLVSRLRQFISTSSEPRLRDCWSKYGDSIKLAQKVVETGSRDISDGQKISLIEEFHHKYISVNARASSARELNQRAAPLMLKTFFVWYAKIVGKILKNNVYLNLRDLTENNEMVAGLIDREDRIPFDDVLDRFSQSFLFELSADRQKFMFLLWNLVDDIAYESRNSVDFSRYVDIAEDVRPGGVHRVIVKMRSVDEAQALQDYCRFHLWPVYARTVLPRLRLTDLGYYLPEIESIPPRWYKATQLCETILPIRFVADDSLASRQVVLVPKEEVKQLATEISYPKLGPMPNSHINNFDFFNLWWVKTKTETDQIWNDIRARKNLVQRYLSKISSKALGITNYKQGSFFLASKRSEGGEKEDFTEALGESVVEPTNAERRKEKVLGIGRGFKKVAQVAKKALAAALRVVSCILAIVGICFLPVFAKDSPRSLFVERLYMDVGDNGDDGRRGMSPALMVAPFG